MNTYARLAEAFCNNDSICLGCAYRYGATTPDGHEATMWLGECSVCGDLAASCCSASDFNWPNVKGGKAVERAREL